MTPRLQRLAGWWLHADSDRGRMASATIGANTVSYKFNGLDQRVSKTGPTAVVPSGAAYYAYGIDQGAGQLIGEYDASVKPGFETITLGATPVAVLKQTGSASNSTLQVVAYNVWADHLDTPRVVTRSSDQAIVWRWDSAEAFGATAPNQNPNALGIFSYNQRFPGQLVDLETGSFYNWYRDYRAGVGRYVQSDPIGLAGGINTYSYALNQPTKYTDPEGKLAIPVVVGSALVIGAGWWIYNNWQNSWEKDVDKANWGPKNEFQFHRCNTPEDRDCRTKRIELQLLYSKIKLAELIGLNDLVAKSVYNDEVRKFRVECPYWQDLPMMK